MRVSKKLILAVMACIAMQALFAATPIPVEEELVKLLSTDLEDGDRFGNAVAVDGNTAVIGALYEEDTANFPNTYNRGAAYVFTRDGSGVWSQQAKLIASDWASDDQFGSSVALDGDTAVIGAWYEDSDGYSANGAAYVFTRDGGAWTQQAKLLAPDKASWDVFGYSVAVDGDTAVIGAIYEDSDGVDGNGAAYVFTRTSGAWSFQAKLLADDKARWDSFGNSVAVSGDTVAIGSPGHSTPYANYAGVVYMFTRSGETWNQTAQLAASDQNYGDEFGSSVDLEGDIALIGAPDKASPYSYSGAAYVFTRDGGGYWNEQAKLLASDLASESSMFDRFGCSVAIDGDVAVIGSRNQDSDGVSNNGAAYVFARDGSGVWTEQMKLLASDKATDDWFGGTLDISGATIIVGVPMKDYKVPGDDYSGAAYIYGLAASDGPPVVSGVAAQDVTFPADVILTATATDAESTIESAGYTLDGGTSWLPMDPADDTFDSAAEELTATLSGLAVGSYEVCVRATDDQGNTSEITQNVNEGDCASFEVSAAQLTVAFTGELLNADGDKTRLNAEITGPNACATGAEVYFSALREDEAGTEYWEDLGYSLSVEPGLATLELALDPGIYDIKVEVQDQYLDGEDDLPECLGDTDAGITVVADARASSTGGGWYKIDGLTPPRVNFGYTAQTKYNKKLDEYSTSGNLLWMHQDNYRLKGTINAGGKLPDEACPGGFATCAAFAGEGTLYQPNPAYDPDCEEPYGCEPEWTNAIANNPFIFFVNDGGVVLECLNKKKCKEVEKPDQFGIQIDLESVPAESDPVYLNGGNLVVR
jgi:hypothetical protein